MTITTPTVRTTARKSLFWVLAAVFAIVVAIVSLLLTGSSSPGGSPLSATSAAPSGAMAVAQVLEQQGVKVASTETLADTTSTLENSPDATLFLYDPNAYLSEDQLRTLAGLTDDLVIMAPTASQLTSIAPGIQGAGAVSADSLTDDCDLPAANRAKSVTGHGRGYRVDSGSDNTVSCFGSGKKTFSLIRIQHDDSTVTVVGTDLALSNEYVAQRGNAALALNLLGEHRTLVWYLPTLDDETLTGAPTIGELTPSWVVPITLLCFCVAIAAAIWRGRRMGPLVIENLPVTVRASETMEGRARLYQRSSSRLHALDSLRIGAVGRLASRCGLPRTASVDEVISAVAALLSVDPRVVHGTLIGTVPANDRDLVHLSDDLIELERAVDAALGLGSRR